MKIGALKERYAGETRVAVTPSSAAHMAKLGHKIFIEAGAGVASGFSDADYEKAGATVATSAGALVDVADVLAKVRQPTEIELGQMKEGQTLISFFYPSQSEALLKQAQKRGVTVIAMDMVPRISRAQKMDALSSMANIAGYRAVIEAANNFGRFFTGQVTAAGKVQPAKVLVIGAGVAGLAAIGAARGLGAIVRAFDVRPEVAEQIESMGGEFLFLDFSDQQDGASTGGYAAPSSPEFRAKQLELFRAQAPEVDVVVTTALIPGRDAPKLWTADMVAAMKAGSVVVDLAAERGGNCDLTVPDQKIVTNNGVTVVGYTDFPSRMGAQASELYANNVRHFVADLTPAKDGAIKHNMEDDVIRGATVTHEGEITFPPPPPKVAAIAAQKPRERPKEVTAQERRVRERAEFRAQSRSQFTLLVLGAGLMVLVGVYAPPSFLAHFIVFVLACFVGFQVIWNVSHSLHTPLMAVTNAVSGIIILGALLQIGLGSSWVIVLSAISVLIASINIVGGFLVTRRMLAMFQKS
ncbi:Re/Si-specific NAD(P)(+) transhydrogenase subunit alpha [Labrys okinawensis]|uniref:Re/Si-specific NAD(P)(+) transhydrogenase subunit alpha n=1 Tax=Labrys okinawensis TaxID=346911 RepID=UPI0039BC7581